MFYANVLPSIDRLHASSWRMKSQCGKFIREEIKKFNPEHSETHVTAHFHDTTDAPQFRDVSAATREASLIDDSSWGVSIVDQACQKPLTEDPNSKADTAIKENDSENSRAEGIDSIEDPAEADMPFPQSKTPSKPTSNRTTPNGKAAPHEHTIEISNDAPLILLIEPANEGRVFKASYSDDPKNDQPDPTQAKALSYSTTPGYSRPG